MQYISRQQWGAVPPSQSLAGWGAQLRGIAIHYVGGAGTIGLDSHDRCAPMLRSLQTTAMSGSYTWKYSDLEYNLVGCPHGYVFEGRGLRYQGAAQLNANHSHGSVLAMANVADRIQGTQLASAVNDAVAAFQAAHPAATEVVGHRDTAGNPSGTECPGAFIEAWIRAGRPAGPNEEADDVEHGMHAHSAIAAGNRVIQLDRWGGLHTSNGARLVTKDKAYWQNLDNARTIALSPECLSDPNAPLRGYLVDLNGGHHPFVETDAAGAPRAAYLPDIDVGYWPGGKQVRFVEL